MVDREKVKAVIDGLRCAAGDPTPCAKCRYRAYIYNICKCKCAEDAIALLNLLLKDSPDVANPVEFETIEEA